MVVRVLGTGTSAPSLDRGSAACLLSTPEGKVLVDIGPSVVRRLVECGLTTGDVDAVVLTHFHVDHTADLATFLFASNYGGAPRTKPLAIFGGPGLGTFLSRLKALYPWIAPKSYEMSVVPLGSRALTIAGMELTSARVSHNRESVALRFAMGKSVTVSGDTGYSRNLVRLASGTDLLVLECSFPEDRVRGHLNIALASRVVREAGPRMVLLSHLYPEWRAYTAPLPPPLLLAEDGMEIELA